MSVARNKAEQLIRKLEIRKAPVDVERIASQLKIIILEQELDDISGLLITNTASKIIGVNKKHPVVRKRFTIAHELGHFCLGHQLEPGEHVFVDRGNFISARGTRAATGMDPKEVEANQFAASLLMPAEIVAREAKRVRGSAPGLFDTHVSELAAAFAVSEQAMTIRLGSLGLL